VALNLQSLMEGLSSAPVAMPVEAAIRRHESSPANLPPVPVQRIGRTPSPHKSGTSVLTGSHRRGCIHGNAANTLRCRSGPSSRLGAISYERPGTYESRSDADARAMPWLPHTRPALRPTRLDSPGVPSLGTTSGSLTARRNHAMHRLDTGGRELSAGTELEHDRSRDEAKGEVTPPCGKGILLDEIVPLAIPRIVCSAPDSSGAGSRPGVTSAHGDPLRDERVAVTGLAARRSSTRRRHDPQHRRE